MTDNLTFDPAKKIQENPTISFCSACFNQEPSKRHVDFGASYDGPVMSTGSEENPIRVSIDELVLCEDCLSSGAEILGLVNADEQVTANEELAQRVEELSERLAGAVAYISKLEETASTRGTLAAELKAG